MGVEFVVDTERTRCTEEGIGLFEKLEARLARGNEIARSPTKRYVAILRVN